LNSKTVTFPPFSILVSAFFLFSHYFYPADSPVSSFALAKCFFLYKVLKLLLFYLVGEVRLQDWEQESRSSRDSTMSISKADSERKRDVSSRKTNQI